MKRVAALVVAVGLVLGALYVRGYLDRSDDEGPRAGDVLRLRCASELRRACQALESAAGEDLQVTIATAGVTADELAELGAGEDPGFDVWLTDASWHGIVADNRRVAALSGQVLGEPSGVLGRSPAVLLVESGRAEQLTQDCGGGITWSCVGEQAAGPLSVGIPSPDRGDGLVVLAAAVANRLGTADYATNDFDAAGFGGWFDALHADSTRRSFGERTLFEQALAARGFFHVVGSLAAERVQLGDRGAAWVSIYPEPVLTSDIVLVPAVDVDLADALDRVGGDRLGDALAANGWRVEGRPAPPDDAPELPAGSDMPAPGVLQALRDRW